MHSLAQIFSAVNRIRPALQARGLRRIGVFGSVARGTARSDSDVDFLVELEDRCDLLDVVAMKILLKNELGCEVDVVSEGGPKHDIRESILREVRYAA
jgi:predicted nucleotidyltransferase